MKRTLLHWLGLLGVISLLSYAASVFIAPIAYPGYQWTSMAVSELSAVGAPSRDLANQLCSLFAPCGLVCVMAVCVEAGQLKSKALRIGIYLFAMMEWVCMVGYDLFPWNSSAASFSFQNIMHIGVTAAVVVLSVASLIVIALSAGKAGLKPLGIWAAVCLTAMLAGAIGTNILPKAVFGIAERFSTFSAVIFNAVLGMYLYRGCFSTPKANPLPENLEKLPKSNT